MPILTTERLYISEITEEDASFIFALMNAPKWIKYIGDRRIQTVNHAKEYINSTIVDSYTTRGYGFYKVILKKDTNRPEMIAFLMPHQDSNASLKEFVVSADHIEKITGIDFFPSLEDDVEKKIEATSSTNGWKF